MPAIAVICFISLIIDIYIIIQLLKHVEIQRQLLIVGSACYILIFWVLWLLFYAAICIGIYIFLTPF